tara:strand:- start:282 stop:1010 length:729 start_codon:yes stop_codon:yes gene_type:complete
MALPKLDVPIYKLNIPSSGKEISYRPFLVKEEKILLMAMEGGDDKEITTAIKQIINNCVVDDGIEVDNMPLFDIEYMLLNIRARSMGDVVKTSYVNKKCKREDCSPVEIEIDLSTIEVSTDENHKSKIELNDKVGIIMKYPSMYMMDKKTIGKDRDASTEDVFEVISECIDKIYDADNVYNQSDYTKDELKEFVDSFTSEQFKQIQKFFDTMPKMYKDVVFSCEKCNYKEDIKIEGLAGFFT